MRTDFSTLSHKELADFFLKFKAFAQAKLKTDGTNWTHEIKQIIRTGKRRWNHDIIDDYLKSLSVMENTKAREGFTSLMIKCCDLWKLEIDKDLNISVRADHNSNIKYEHHYICYYWLKDNDFNKGHAGVDIGYFCIGYDHADTPLTATMKLFDLYIQAESKVDKKIPSAIITANQKNIYSQHPTLIVRLDDEANPNIKSQLCLTTDRFTLSGDSNKSLVGTYSSIGRKSSANQPIAGLVAMIPVKSYEQCVEKIMDPDRIIPDNIYHFLFNSRLNLNVSVLLQGSSLLDIKETKDIRPYSAVYQMDLISASKGNLPLLEKAVIVIHPSTKAVIYVPNTSGPSDNEVRDYTGRFRLVNDFNGNLVGSFDASAENKVSRFTIYVYKNKIRGYDGLPDRYYGVYAGIDYLSEKIIAGRMRLTKLPLSINETPETYKNKVSCDPINNSTFEKDIDLLKLFSGTEHDHDYIETYKNYSSYFNISPLRMTNNFAFAGEYFLYGLSSDEDKISRIPLKIDHRGMVTLYRKVRPIHGIATYDKNQALSINIYEEGRTGFMSHYMFSVLGKQVTEQLDYAFGVSVRFQKDTRPAARSEILYRCKEGWANPKGTTRFTINTPSFNDEDLKLEGILSFLTGAYSRYIKMPLTPNKPVKPRKKEYVDVHFYAACYLASIGQNEDAIKNLYQAYLHGFNNLSLLQKETSTGGALNTLLLSKIKTVEPELSISELVEKIKDRILHMNKLPRWKLVQANN